MHVSLRPISLEDADAVQRYASDARLAATCNVPHPYPADGGQIFVRRCEVDRAAGTRFASAVFVDGTFAGIMDLNAIDRDRGSAELDYWIAVPFWGKGVATVAARLAAALAFGELGLRVVYSGCWEGNPASGRVLEKVGFTEMPAVINDGLYGTKFKGERIRRFRLEKPAG